MIHIYYCTSCERLEEKSFNHLLKQMPASVQSQIMKFKKWEDQQRSLFGKMLLLTGLKTLGLEAYSLQDLKYTQFSKPYFDNKIDFNISHSGKYIICAISVTDKIGIDIEEILEIPFVDFEDLFSPEEWKTVVDSDNTLHAFYTLWTQKEAFIKAIGTGLNFPLNKITIKNNKITWEHAEWYLHEVKLDSGYVAYLTCNLLLPGINMQKITFHEW